MGTSTTVFVSLRSDIKTGLFWFCVFTLGKYTVGTKGSVCLFSLRNWSLVVHLRRGGKSWTSTEPRLSTKGGKRSRGSRRGSSSRRQMAPDAGCAGTARGDDGNWLLLVITGGRLVTSAPCCSPSVPAHPMVCAFCCTLQRGHSGSLLGIKLVLELWGSGARANSLPFCSLTKSADHQAPAHLGLFNLHNLNTDCQNICFVSYALSFFFIALSLWEIWEILFWKQAAIASENIARAGETAGAQRESFAAHGTAPGCWGWEEQEGILSRGGGGEEGKAEASVLKDTTFAERGDAGRKQQKELWTRERKAGKGNSRSYFPFLLCFWQCQYLEYLCISPVLHPVYHLEIKKGIIFLACV